MNSYTQSSIMPFVKTVLCSYCKRNIAELGRYADQKLTDEPVLIPRECAHPYHRSCADRLASLTKADMPELDMAEVFGEAANMDAPDATRETIETDDDPMKSSVFVTDSTATTTPTQTTTQSTPIEKASQKKLFSCRFEFETETCYETIHLDEARVIGGAVGFVRCTTAVSEDADRGSLQSKLQLAISESMALRHDVTVATRELTRQETLTRAARIQSRTLAQQNEDLIAAISKTYPDFDYETFLVSKKLPKHPATTTKAESFSTAGKSFTKTDSRSPLLKTRSEEQLHRSPLHQLYEPTQRAAAPATPKANSYKAGGNLVFERQSTKSSQPKIVDCDYVHRAIENAMAKSAGKLPSPTGPPQSKKPKVNVTERKRTTPAKMDHQAPPRGAGPLPAPEEYPREVQPWALPFITLPSVNAKQLMRAEFRGNDDNVEMGFFLAKYLLIGEGMVQCMVRNQILSRGWGRIFSITKFYRPTCGIDEFSAVIDDLPSLPPSVVTSIGNDDTREEGDSTLITEKISSFINLLSNKGVKHLVFLPLLVYEGCSDTRLAVNQWLEAEATRTGRFQYFNLDAILTKEPTVVDGLFSYDFIEMKSAVENLKDFLTAGDIGESPPNSPESN